MKKIFLTIFSIFLLAVFVTPNFALAFSSDVLSNPTFTQSSEGFVYKEASVSENGLTRKLYYGEYNATSEGSRYEWVLHSVRNDSSTTLTTVLNIAKDYEETTGRKVMFATNGDFFFAGGSNVESYVSDGIVLTKGAYSYKHCLGFDNNGKIAIGRMTEVETRLAVYHNNKRQLFEIESFNSAPTSGISIYNTAGTYTLQNVGVVIVKTDTASLVNYPVWGTDYTRTSVGVKETNTFTLKSGQFAVVYEKSNEEYFASHVFGEEIGLVEVPSGKFSGCDWVIGGYDILVNDGVVGSEFHTDNGGNDNRARTFLGVKEDGTQFLCVVDETGGSTGITVEKEAQLASVLGAKYALELDGGGSSTSVLRVNDTLTVRNKSIDGASMRAVSNAVLLVEKEKFEVSFSTTSDVTGEAPDMSTYVEGEEVVLPQNTFSREGYMFVGWECDGKTYNEGDVVKMKEDGLVLSPVWEEGSYIQKISFKKSSAMTGDAPDLTGCVTGNILTLPQNTFARGGYVFDGWLINGVVYQAGDTVTVPTEGLEISAVWKADSDQHLTNDPSYTDLYIGLGVCAAVVIASAIVFFVINKKKGG